MPTIKEPMVKVPLHLLKQIIKVETTIIDLEDWLLTYNKKFIKDMRKIKADFEQRRSLLSHEELLKKLIK